MAIRKHGLAAVGCAMVLLAPSYAGAEDARPVMLHLRDYARVPGPMLAEAKREATRIFNAAGVHIVWGEQVDAVSPDPEAVHLRVFILSADEIAQIGHRSELHHNMLGFANRSGGYVFILYPHVVKFLYGRPLALSVVLGRIVAHEVGHLLLPDGSHSKTGIMRERIDDKPTRRHFTLDQASAMRRGLSADVRAAR